MRRATAPTKVLCTACVSIFYVALNNANCESETLPKWAALRPPYPRIDNSEKTRKAGEILMKKSSKGENLVHSTLKGPDKLESYEIYLKDDEQEMVAVAQLGKALCGWPGVIHGGASAALIDNTLGWHYLVLSNKKPGVTMYLNVQYKNMVPADSAVRITSRLRSVSGRKYFIDCTMTDKDGKVLVEAESLFLTLRPTWANWLKQKYMDIFFM